MIKHYTVSIDYTRINPKLKKKEESTRSWTFIKATSPKHAILICKKRLEANEHGNDPKVKHSEALVIKEGK